MKEKPQQQWEVLVVMQTTKRTITAPDSETCNLAKPVIPEYSLQQTRTRKTESCLRYIAMKYLNSWIIKSLLIAFKWNSVLGLDPTNFFAQQRCWYSVLAMGCFTEDQTHWPVELTAFIKAIMLVSLLVFCNFPSLTIINNSTNLEHFRTLRPPHKGHPLLFQNDPAKLSKFR